MLASTEPGDDAQRVAVVQALAHTHAFALGRPDTAIALLASAAAHMPGVHRWQLDNDRALYGAIAGDFSSAIEATEAVITNPARRAAAAWARTSTSPSHGP